MRDAVAAVLDPEVPVLSIADLGILRDVEVDVESRTAVVTITPTYSGCPAMEAIRARVVHAAAQAGVAAEVRTRLTPAWTTDWMSTAGRKALAQFGIAPPEPRGDGGAVPVQLSVRRVDCPLCGSPDTEELSRFGSTACKALRRCRACREPFEQFKTI